VTTIELIETKEHRSIVTVATCELAIDIKVLLYP